MRLSHIIEEYYDAFLTRYGDTALPEQIKALNAILSTTATFKIVDSPH